MEPTNYDVFISYSHKDYVVEHKNLILGIYPISIEPRTELPNDMKNNYHFGEI